MKHFENPCLKCGACCAHFRVSFYWGEADASMDGEVPAELVSYLDDFRSCMKGTNQKHPYCAALQGIIGKGVFCSIYANRPSVCREFGVAWSGNRLVFDPEDLERCNHARAMWGLPALTPRPQHRRHSGIHAPLFFHHTAAPRHHRHRSGGNTPPNSTPTTGHGHLRY